MLHKRVLRQLLAAISIALTILLFGINSYANEPFYGAVDDNPAYKSVTQLRYNDANTKITYGEDPNQFGLLWRAETQFATDTLVIFIHGGCWLTHFDISHTYAATTAIAKAGFNVWSIEYRRTGESGGGWPTTFEDVKNGIAAYKNLQPLGIDPSKIIIAGHSAGGHLALLSGAQIEKILPETKTKVSIVGLAAITDLASYAASEGSCQSAGAKFMGGLPDEFPSEYAKANPLKQPFTLETILFQGGQDPIVPMAQAKALGNRSNVRTAYVEKAGHFDWVHPGTPAFRKFIDYLQTKAQN